MIEYKSTTISIKNGKTSNYMKIKMTLSLDFKNKVSAAFEFNQQLKL